MKYFIFPILTLSLLITVQARTWTSADGQDFISGIYLTSDKTSVTISQEGKEATLKLSLISEEDRKWVATEYTRLIEAEKKPTPGEPTLHTQFIGKNIQGKTYHITDGKFKPVDTQKVPEYYLFYYSASW